YVCTVNAEELTRGLRPSKADAAARLVAGLRAAPSGPAEGWRAGEWRRDFARRGRTLSRADCLVAAAARAVDARLATGNPKDQCATCGSSMGGSGSEGDGRAPSMLNDVEIVEAFFDAIYRLDFDAALEFFPDAATSHDMPVATDPAVGKEAIRR